MTKIKKDFIGLYVVAGGQISRPFYGTIFKEGDEVKTHGFIGTVNAGVTYPHENFSYGNYEVWGITGILNYYYKETPPIELEEKTKAYERMALHSIYDKHNLEFKELYGQH